MHIAKTRTKHGAKRKLPATPEVIARRQKRLAEYYAQDDLAGWVNTSMGNAKRRAKEKGLEFTLSKDDLIGLAERTSHCPILNVELEYFRGRGDGPRGSAASIDRIDNERGYTPDNVRIISQRANVAKSYLTMTDLINLAMYCLAEAKSRL